jgi:hypothetical protein
MSRGGFNTIARSLLRLEPELSHRTCLRLIGYNCPWSLHFNGLVPKCLRTCKKLLKRFTSPRRNGRIYKDKCFTVNVLRKWGIWKELAKGQSRDENTEAFLVCHLVIWSSLTTLPWRGRHSSEKSQPKTKTFFLNLNIKMEYICDVSCDVWKVKSLILKIVKCP